MIIRRFLVVVPLLAALGECQAIDRRRALPIVRPPPAVEAPAIGADIAPRPVSNLENVPVPAPAAARPPTTGGGTRPAFGEGDPNEPVVPDGGGEPSTEPPAPRPASPPEQQPDPPEQAPVPNSSPKQPTQPKQPNNHPDPAAEVFILPPIPKDDETMQEEAVLYDLGSYQANQEVLFGNFKGPQDVFMSKVFDYFSAEPSYITGDAYISATGSQPFQNGPKPTGQALRFTAQVKQVQQGAGPSSIVTTFNPKAPKDVCAAWTSLARYCSGGGTSCACSSSAYYVPDQWNSLAAKCASVTTECDKPTTTGTAAYWCSLGRAASNAKGFCPTTGLASGTTPVKFAATAGLPSTAAATTTGVAGYVQSGVLGTTTSRSSIPSATSSPNTISSSNGQSSSASILLSPSRNMMVPRLMVVALFAAMIYI